MTEKQDYESRLEAKLEDWRQKIESLRAKSRDMEPERRAQCEAEIERLEQKRAEMETVLANLELDDAHGFNESRRRSDEGWTIMDDGLATALVRYN